jgi:triacylglycerol lipase
MVLVAGPARAFCLFRCNVARTKHPIVLTHGMAGFDQLFGVVEYFSGIPSELRSKCATVYVTQVSEFNSTAARGEQWIDQIETIVAVAGKANINLIEGLEARASPLRAP